MNRPVRSRVAFGMALAAALLWSAAGAMAQAVPGLAAPGAAGSDILRIRKMAPVPATKTPIYQASVRTQASARSLDWWRVMVEYETAPEWIDELEFTYYAYLEDQSNKNAPVMFRGTVTYVNIPKGRHFSDMFLHPNVVARMGAVKQIAVVVKAKGATVAMESTATRANWWDGFSPVDGVMMNRSQTPFAFVDFDTYEAIKPSAAAR